MRYELTIKQPLRFFVNDRPDLEMQLTATNINGVKSPVAGLLGVTARWTRAGGSGFLYNEQLTENGSGAGQFVFKAPIKTVDEQAGAVLVRVFENAGIGATISAPLTDSAGSIDITITAGVMPAVGIYRINDEWGEFTFSGSTVTFTSRGLLQTAAAAHNSGDKIEFSSIQETAQPPFQYKIERDENAL